MTTNYHTQYEQNRLNDNPEIEPFFYDIDPETAARAYHNTSHYPERAGSLIRSDYALQLLEDKATVTNAVNHAQANNATIDHNYQDLLDSWFVEHRRGLKEKYLAYLHSHMNVASAFICGPAKFPTARNQKRSQWADNHYDNISKFRHTSKKRILSEILPYGDGSVIRTDDPDATDKVSSKVAELERQRDHMKLINKIVRKFYKKDDSPTPDDGKYDQCLTAMVENGVANKATAKTYLTPNYMGQCIPFETWQLSNLGAEIRRLKQRAEDVEQVQSLEIDDTFPNGETAAISGDGKIVIDFGYKPSEEIRAALKRRAFKWSPKRVAWVRKLTTNAVADYEHHIKPILQR